MLGGRLGRAREQRERGQLEALHRARRRPSAASGRSCARPRGPAPRLGAGGEPRARLGVLRLQRRRWRRRDRERDGARRALADARDALGSFSAARLSSVSRTQSTNAEIDMPVTTRPIERERDEQHVADGHCRATMRAATRPRRRRSRRESTSWLGAKMSLARSCAPGVASAAIEMMASTTRPRPRPVRPSWISARTKKLTPQSSRKTGIRYAPMPNSIFSPSAPPSASGARCAADDGDEERDGDRRERDADDVAARAIVEHDPAWPPSRRRARPCGKRRRVWAASSMMSG